MIHCGSGPNRFPPIQSFSPLTLTKTKTKTKNEIRKKKTENDAKEKNTLAPTGLLYLIFSPFHICIIFPFFLLPTFLLSTYQLPKFKMSSWKYFRAISHHSIISFLSQGPLHLNCEVSRLLVDLRRRHRGQDRPGHHRRLLRADGRYPEVVGDRLYPFLPVTGLLRPVIVAFSPM